MIIQCEQNSSEQRWNKSDVRRSTVWAYSFHGWWMVECTEKKLLKSNPLDCVWNAVFSTCLAFVDFPYWTRPHVPPGKKRRRWEPKERADSRKCSFFLGWNLVVIMKSPLFHSSNELRMALRRWIFDWWKKKMDLIVFSMRVFDGSWCLGKRLHQRRRWSLEQHQNHAVTNDPLRSMRVAMKGNPIKIVSIRSGWQDKTRPIDKENSIVAKVWSEWEGVEGKCPTG